MNNHLLLLSYMKKIKFTTTDKLYHHLGYLRGSFRILDIDENDREKILKVLDVIEEELKKLKVKSF